MFGFLGGGFGGGSFEAHYRAMPVAFIDKQSAEYGDKVILPPSALDRLASLHIEYPMLFRVESPSGRVTHCGVLEFVAEEGVVYMPHWMMQNMLLQVGDMVKFKNVSLPKGTYVKLQPVTSDFLDITNPKAVLERTLRSYTCLTVGDCFVVNYNNKNYEIEVKEAKPNRAISVVETDCQVDFEAPKDYKEPERVFRQPAAQPAAAAAAAGASTGAGSSKGADAGKAGDKGGGASTSGKAADGAENGEADGKQTILAFAGTARRLDGKPITTPSQPVPVELNKKHGMTYADASAPAAAPGDKSSKTEGGPKAGTFVSTGNRLLDKLERDKMAAAAKSGAAPAPAANGAGAKSGEPKKDDKSSEEDKSGPSFKAFQGKGYSLKG